MDSTVHHSLPNLFAQLGLPDDDESIQQFIARHAPLPGDMLLPDAPFWTPSQAALLRSEWKADADWAEVVDTLNTLLHQTEG
ncbi:MAG TPA: DUF2789 domain-containing protein [Ideonella sp.]|jgi:hypothetical protein|nr:DUF2789 domain-containing protein [Ideonella sp.]